MFSKPASRLSREFQIRLRGFTSIDLAVVTALVSILATITVGQYREADIRANVTTAMKDMRAIETAVFDYITALISASKEGRFPPAGGVAQAGWMAWTNAYSYAPNAAGNNMWACSIIWVEGSFYDDKGDSEAKMAAPPPTGNQHFDLRVMTSPIEALISVPLDPFKNSGGPDSQYDFFGLDLRDSFVLRSLGPDRIAAVGCGSNGFRCACGSESHDCLSYKETVRSRSYVGTEFCENGCETVGEALRVGYSVYSPTNGTESTGDLWRLSI